MATWIIYFFFVWISVARGDWSSLCPSNCVCKWSDSKRVADCTNAGFTAIPQTLSGEIQVLYLDGNPIEFLPKEAFTEAKLVNLQKVYVRGCSLKKIDKDAFQGLAIMIGLDLSNNELHSLHPDIFQGNPKLRALHLNNNTLGKLEEKLFLNLPALKQLELRRCGLERLEKKIFMSLVSLEKLDLSENRFKELSPDIFTPVISSLKELNLKDNPWRCDCRLRELRRQLYESNLLSNSPVCIQPERLAQKKWSQVELGDFACVPTITVIEPHVEAKAGGEVTFSCLVSGNPMPETKWILNGRILANMSQIPYGDQLFVIFEKDISLSPDPEKWTNLTVKNIDEHDGGIYTCSATNAAGVSEGNATLTFPASPVIVIFGRDSEMGLSFMAVIGICTGAAFLLLLIVIVVIFWVFATRRRRKRRRTQEKTRGGVIGSEEHDKSLLGTELTDLTFDKINNGDYESLSQNDARISETYIPGEKYDDRLSELHNQSSHSILEGNGRLVPDLLDLPTRRGESPSTGSGASTAPDTSKLPHSQQPLNAAQLYYTPDSKMATLGRIPAQQYVDGVMIPVARPGYVTLPRRPRPRVPSWASTPVPSPAPSDLLKGDTMYDSVGPRTTADGSSTSALSLNRIAGLTPIPGASPMVTPNRSGTKYSLPPYYMPVEEAEFARRSPLATQSGRSSTLPRSTPNILDASDDHRLFSDSYSVQITPPRIDSDLRTPMSRASIASVGSQAPSIDGRKKTPPAVAPKPKRPVSAVTAPSVILEDEPLGNSDSPRKVPPRPPPKPKKRLSVAESVAEVPEGFEDEGADGTEV